MKTNAEWLAGRTADFTPEEMASALAWIADVQRDAIEAADNACAAQMAEEWKRGSDADEDCLAIGRAQMRIRVLLP